MSAKSTFLYLYFPNGEVNAVLGIDVLSNGIWWYPAHRPNVEKYFAIFNWEKISSTFGTGQINFLMTWQSMSRHCPSSPEGRTMMGADQLD